MEESLMARKVRVSMYSRVSTDGQNTDGQESEMRDYAKNRGWEVTRVYRDKMSGVKSSRPALDELMADARKRAMDIVLVWRFDRFARSVSHLLQALESFRIVGIEFVSISEQVDTSTPTGKMVFTVLGAVAELERSLIVERVRMGLQSARKKGKRLGRPPIRQLNPAELVKVRADRATGKFSLRKLAKKYGTSVWAMQQATTGKASQIGGYEN
jgi:DNA invertase Pin-like site-specific DNA recombinase